MDKDTVRIILLILGVLIIAGIYVWGRYRKTLSDFVQRRGDFAELGFDESFGRHAANEDARELGSVGDQTRSRFDAAGFSVRRHGSESEEVKEGDQPAAGVVVTPRETAVGAPFLIQVSVVARSGDSFSGEELRDALLDLGLIYGEMEIFHRYDRHLREPLFSVASLVKPGTFPIDDMESFECPGVVLFFQPAQVADSLAVFDDLFETSRDLAEKLDGIEWDEYRRPLTEARIREMRERLAEICG